MGDVAQTHLIPIQELTPGAVGAIRNQVINNLVAQVSKELNLPAEKLVVRDVLPKTDLQMYALVGTDATTEMWGITGAGTTTGYVAMSGTKTMGDQRYVALFGVRDRGMHHGPSGSATVPITGVYPYKEVVSLIKINVGGADKVTWDISCIRAYADNNVAFTPSAVIIPQNASFVISYYKTGSIEVGALTAPVASEIHWLQLIGVTIEPRGKTISP